ncbi:MAG: ABC transporter permease [Candidatus Baltobacteraceae bacterium]
MMYVQEALRVLFANKVRSLLTMLGLIIGVGAVIAIQTLGSSMAGAIGGALGNLADNSFFIQPNFTQPDYQRALVTRSDIAALGTLPNVATVIPLTGANDLVRHGHRQARYYITGDAAQPFNNGPLQSGRRITQDDIDKALSVTVITDRALHRLFAPGENALGQSLYAGLNRYVVVGVLAPPRSGLINATFGGDLYAPYTTVIRQYVRGTKVGAARVIVADASKIDFTELAVITKLRALHRDPRLQYNTFDKAQLTGGINGIFSGMTVVVGIIGAVSLLVAGIGIMNIMLVSVTERTREIGVRKAIGARAGQILLQFFIEALLLCSVGCFTGMAIGLSVGAAVNSIAIVKLTGYTAPLPWVESIVVAAAFALIVTLCFGTYPAYRAAVLDPIEALRHE